SCITGPTTPIKPRGQRPLLSTLIRHRLILHATQNAVQRRKPWRQITNKLGITASDNILTTAFYKEGYYR
ncbi:hypothetical protein K432DRAFT_312152, partial [Lepidopterella palustris CBS 459.81]